MKKKQITHPRIYLKVLKKKDSFIIAEYKDNEFNSKGNRIIKKAEIYLDKYLNDDWIIYHNFISL